jgi:hypothetical protein
MWPEQQYSENDMRRVLKRRIGVQREGKNREMPCSFAFWMSKGLHREKSSKDSTSYARCSQKSGEVFCG